MYFAQILADSVNTLGERLTTFLLTYPRIIHDEFMTHRVFSRNAASSRAIPVQRMIDDVMRDPVLPVWWGKNQSGMQANEEISPEYKRDAVSQWLAARDRAVSSARILTEYGVHKQIANRLLTPFMWITVIVSSTEWENFFGLRQDEEIPENQYIRHQDSITLPQDKMFLNTSARVSFNPQFPAQPEIQVIAYLARVLYRSSVPVVKGFGDYHLPLVERNDIESLRDSFNVPDIIKISVGRCARVSYLTHQGVRDPQADIELHDRLMISGHWSPFEHVAYAKTGIVSGNFHGWEQYRKSFAGEDGRKKGGVK